MRGNRGWLLALDLSNPEGLLALEGPRGLFQRTVEGGSRVARLFTAAGEMLDDAGITPRDIGLMGVGRGPGSFTGVRVAVMAAKSLALILDIPLVAPDSLKVMAMEAVGLAETVLVAMDARRGQLYYALYRLQGGRPVALEGPCVALPREVSDALLEWRREFPESMAILGSGVDAYPGAWPHDLVFITRVSPSPRGLTGLCRQLQASEETCHAINLLPLYIRSPDARERFARGKEGVS